MAQSGAKCHEGELSLLQVGAGGLLGGSSRLEAMEDGQSDEGERK